MVVRDSIVKFSTEQQVLSSKQKRFVFLFIATLIISFSPFKSIGQLVTFIFFAGLVFFVRVQAAKHVFRLVLVFLVISAAACLYYLILREFSFINYYLFSVTISAFLIFLADLRPVITQALMSRLEMITLIFLSLQSLYGILQGIVGFIRSGTLDGGVGDIVRGTIEPGFTTTTSASNYMFAILISTLFLFTLALSSEKFSKLRVMVYMIIVIAWLMAAVMHTIVFVAAAGLAGFFLQLFFAQIKHMTEKSNEHIKFRFKKWKIVLGLLVMILILPIPFINPTNFRNLPHYFSNTFVIRERSASPKGVVTFRTLFLVPEEVPIQPVFGVGPGQYNSRAAMIATGKYLSNTPTPSVLNYMSTLTEKNVWDLFVGARGGSTFAPFYSWLTLYGEMGSVGIIIALCFFLSYIWFFLRHRSNIYPRMPIAVLILVIYVALLGIQDNYWEFTQAIFPALLAIKIGHTFIVNGRKSIGEPA